MARTIEWNEEEVMSKEFALSVIDGIRRFHRRIKFSPEIAPFESERAFESDIRVLNGLKRFIEEKVTE